MTATCATCGTSLRGGPRYPLSTLLDMMGHPSANQAAAALGVSGTTYVRYSCHGVSERTADRLAVRAGFTPHEVWHELTDHQIDAESVPCRECQTLFVPTRRGHKFCSRQCGHRRASRERMRRRYQEDPEERMRRREAYRSYYQECRTTILRTKRRDRAAEAESRRRRYREDPEYRERVLTRRRERRQERAA